MTILLDGAMGTELARRGARMELPLWSAYALLEAPELVQQIHLEYLQASAQVITTNTFRTHARNLAAAGLANRAKELTQKAVHLAQQARELHLKNKQNGQNRSAKVDIRIAGSISPLEDCYEPQKSPLQELAYTEHRQIAEHLAEAGCDIFLLETMSRVHEARAAVLATQDLGCPIWLAVVCDQQGCLLGGESFTELMDALAGLSLDALLINCTDLGDLPSGLVQMLEAAKSRPELQLGIYPHTGHNDPQLGWQPHAIDRFGFAKQLFELVTQFPRLQIVGSCCGSTPEWTRELARYFC